ncbi:MAG: hypothetical protein NEA02_00465 [Thermoanaerobaculia bacterium]|nr:hypothetical protein [Thermoanaerobaculia bacterium]
MSPVGDEDLRRLFEERRISDEEKAPPFRMLLTRGRSGPRLAPIGPARLVAAAAAILAVAVSLSLFRRQPAVRVGDWKAPTDFLLEAPYPGLLDSTPTLPEAVPDYSLLLATEKGTTP